MNEISKLTADRGSKGSEEHKVRPIDQLDASKLARRLVLFRPGISDIERMLKEAEERLGRLATGDVVREVAKHNADSLWAVARKSSFDPANPRGEGFFSLLFLNKEGLTALAGNTVDWRKPPLAMLVRQGERPEGIYFWATYAPGPLAGAISLVFDKLSKPPYDGVTLYTRTTTPDGVRFTEMLGFRRGPVIYGISAPHLHVYERPQPKPSNAPLYDTYRVGNDRKTVSVTVARDANDWMRVVSIRSAVYIGEQACPYEEEFDGNDFAAVHLLGYVGDEPAACIRIRHFADFAKVERLAVRKEFRHTVVSFQLVKAAIELCRAKGYRRIYGHAQKRLLNFWGRFGAVPIPGKKEFAFSDFDYVEVMGEFEPNPHAIGIGSDPYVIIRPEGKWHESGVLERSAARPVTRPSVGM